MAKVVGLNQWVNRTTREFVQQTSSGEMERRFPGGVFHDAEGEPTSNANWIHAPDLSAVAGFRNIYWIITGDVVSLMPQAERDAVDAAALETQRDSVAAELDEIESVLRAFMKIVVNEINIVRAALKPSLPARTFAQLKAALRAGLGT